MDFETLSLSTEKDFIAIITINRPDKLNALNATVIDELDRCLQVLKADDNIKVVIITGAGEKAFVAGADIRQFTELTPATAEEFARRGQAVFDSVESLGKPVIAAVNGFALGGGCELALACHVRIASSKAKFGQPEVKLGVIPGYGGTQRLPRIVGAGIATEMILTGEMIGAERAERIGLVSSVSTPEDLIDTAIAMAETIGANAPVALKLSMDAIAYSNESNDGMENEARLFGEAFATQDVTEGVAAFLERRSPKFAGK